jgi:hypothetical protein
VIAMITAKDLNELISLKKSDRDRFMRLIEEMASLDILLSYKKFKEYPANI